MSESDVEENLRTNRKRRLTRSQTSTEKKRRVTVEKSSSSNSGSIISASSSRRSSMGNKGAPDSLDIKVASRPFQNDDADTSRRKSRTSEGEPRSRSSTSSSAVHSAIQPSRRLDRLAASDPATSVSDRYESKDVPGPFSSSEGGPRSRSSTSSSAVHSAIQPSRRLDRLAASDPATSVSGRYESKDVPGPFSSIHLNMNPPSDIATVSNATSSFVRGRSDSSPAVPSSPFTTSYQSRQLVEVAEFARKRSAVIPALPAGTLPLLWVTVFFLGVSLIIYTSLCSSNGNCIDPRAMLNSFGQIDGERATELFEKYRASVAPTADYVVDKLNQIWSKICAGEFSELSQLFTDRDIRIAVIMYIGTVIACTGGYLTFATMDGSDSFAHIVSTFSPSDGLQLVSDRFEANSAAFTLWRETTTASVFKTESNEEDDKNDNAPTPSFSLSSLFIHFGKVILWVMRKGEGFFRINKVDGEKNKIEIEIENENENENRYEVVGSEDNEIGIMNSKINEKDSEEEEYKSPEHSSSSSERLRNQITIFLKAKKPQILSFLQRLDVTAGIILMLLLLLLIFLYHRSIKQFLSFCFIPSLTIICGFFAGKMTYAIYRWNKEKKELKNRQIVLVAAFAKKLLNNKHKGGPYPIEFLFEEMKDIISDGIVDPVVANVAISPFKKKRVSFGVKNSNATFSPLPSSIKDEFNDLSEGEEVDLKTFKLIWFDVQKEVLTDKRILSVLMIYEGAQRKCWKTMGAKSVLSPIPPLSNRTAVANVLAGNRSTRSWGFLGWGMFFIEIFLFMIVGVFKLFFHILSYLWKRSRK